MTAKQTNERIREVYRDNFVQELAIISTLIEKYKYISMDTEFPGFVYQNAYSMTESNGYMKIKSNVDNLKLIQVGITLSDEEGNSPHEYSCWQFNLNFDINKDMYTLDAITLLANCGIDFQKIAEKGIPFDIFGEYFASSGLVLNEDVSWISFQGSFDFAYLLKTLHCLPLPETESAYQKLLSLYFPNHYDIKQLIKEHEYLKGSLSKLSEFLDIKRLGFQHQAGSDSLVTQEVFFKLLEKRYFSKKTLEMEKNVLFDFDSYYQSQQFYNPIPIIMNNSMYTNKHQVNYNGCGMNATHGMTMYNSLNMPVRVMFNKSNGAVMIPSQYFNTAQYVI